MFMLPEFLELQDEESYGQSGSRLKICINAAQQCSDDFKQSLKLVNVIELYSAPLFLGPNTMYSRKFDQRGGLL